MIRNFPKRRDFFRERRVIWRRSGGTIQNWRSHDICQGGVFWHSAICQIIHRYLSRLAEGEKIKDRSGFQPRAVFRLSFFGRGVVTALEPLGLVGLLEEIVYVFGGGDMEPVANEGAELLVHGEGWRLG